LLVREERRVAALKLDKDGRGGREKKKKKKGGKRCSHLFG